MPNPSRPNVHMSAKLAVHWSPVGTMQRMVCLTPRGVESETVGGAVLFGLGVTEMVGAEVVVKSLKLASVAVFVPEETLGLSVTEFVLEETTGPIEESDSEPVTVMEAVTVSVTVTAGHVLSIPWAAVKATSREKIKAAMRRDVVHLDIILAVITND